jgi:hypothetical protein
MADTQDKETPKDSASSQPQTPSQTQSSASPKSGPEPLYTRDEILAAASAFGTSPHIVAGALRLTDKQEMTRAEAERLIKDFLNRKV